MEKLIYMTLLAVHNIAAITCVAGPFYMARIVKARSRSEKRIIHDMDRLMEDVITSQPPICWAALIVLVATGFAFPAVHYLFHGMFKGLTTVGWIALGLKLAAVAGMAVILYGGTFIFNPKLKELFARFKSEDAPDPKVEQEFFALRARRKYWCDRCWNLGVIVLIASAILRWS